MPINPNSKRYQKRNRTNPNIMTSSAQKQRANSAIDGRGGRLSSFTGGARSVNIKNDSQQGMINAWERNANPVRTRGANGRFNGTDRGDIQTVTRTKTGRMSEDGKTAGGYTHGFSKNTGDGHASGGLLSRRQRYYQVRVGLGLAGG